MKKIVFLPILTICLMLNACCGDKRAASGSCCSEAQICCESSIKIITAHKFIKADKVAEFIEFTKDAIAKSRAEEGCISYTLYQDPSDSTKFMFYEEWKDQAAIDFHFSTDHFKMSGSRAAEFEDAPTILNIYNACKACCKDAGKDACLKDSKQACETK